MSEKLNNPDCLCIYCDIARLYIKEANNKCLNKRVKK